MDPISRSQRRRGQLAKGFASLHVLDRLPGARLKDVIIQLEPGLFRKVAGLHVMDFELLVSLGVFNSPLMNDAMFKLKRYADSSLSCTGINMREGENIGLHDTVAETRTSGVPPDQKSSPRRRKYVLMAAPYFRRPAGP